MRSHTKKTVMNHVRALRAMVDGLRNEQRYNGERLDTMRRLCDDSEDTLHFALYLAKKIQQSVAQNPTLSLHKTLIDESLALFEPFVHGKTITSKELTEIKIQVARLESVQDLFIPKNGERIRIIRDWSVLVVETAISCLLYPKESTSRGLLLCKHYCEVSIEGRGKGLLIESADRLEDVADFWEDHYKNHHDEVVSSVLTA